MGKTSDSLLVVMPGLLGDPSRACGYDSGEPGPGGKPMGKEIQVRPVMDGPRP